MTGDAGIQCVHDAGPHRPRELADSLGPGLVWLDYDGDGRLDLLCAHSGRGSGKEPGLRLWRNRGDGTFTDASAAALPPLRGFRALGAVAADWDGDGRPDLCVTGIGGCRLLRNAGDGRFQEAAGPAGLAAPPGPGGAPAWSTGAAFFDADGDGDLDLYVGRYCSVGAADARRVEIGGRLVTPAAGRFPAQGDLFFRNRGGGRFEEAGRELGLRAAEPGRALCVLAFDADGDGRLELFVGNDGSPGFLFRRGAGGRYQEAGFETGLAVGEAAGDLSSRSAAVLDLNEDGRVDLLVARGMQEPTGCYLGIGGGRFRERSSLLGLGFPTLPRSGFGLALVDPDRDGVPEIVQLNGHPGDTVEAARAGSADQLPQLFARRGRRFLEVPQAGPAFSTAVSGRAAAAADYDGDGDLDLAVSENGGPLRLWRCDGSAGSWLSVRLRGRAPNTDGIGARVIVEGGGRRREAQVTSGGGFLGGTAPHLYFGLGDARQAGPVQVLWPGGSRSVLRNVAAGRTVTIQQ